MSHDTPDWVQLVRTRRLTGAFHLLLDALEPIGPLGAQIMWVAQPISSLFGWQNAVRDLAQALETPEGISALRQRLEDNPAAGGEDEQDN